MTFPTGSTDPDTLTAHRASRLVAVIIGLYLVATLVPMWRYTALSAHRAPLVWHAAFLVAALLMAYSQHSSVRALRLWLPLIAGPFLYIELRWLIQGAGQPMFDPVVIGWEQLLFAGNPSATWAGRLRSTAASELLHLSYASYYLLVYLPPLLLQLRGQRAWLARTMLALTVVYGACFLTYLLFPVAGPRYLLGPAEAPDGPIRDFVLSLLAAGSSRGTAFPSSHVAASIVASLCALQSQRNAGFVVAALTAGLTLGTVYGGFHYAVDSLAGLAVGVLSWAIARVIWRALSAPGVQSARAP